LTRLPVDGQIRDRYRTEPWQMFVQFDTSIVYLQASAKSHHHGVGVKARSSS
jgi:hypothetical protein